MRVEGEILERHADVARLRRRADHRAAVDPDVALVRLDHAGDQPQQHRLAGARRAEDHDGLAPLDLERHTVQHSALADSA